MLSPGERIAKDIIPIKATPGQKPIKKDNSKQRITEEIGEQKNRTNKPKNQCKNRGPQANLASLIPQMYNLRIQPNGKPDRELSKPNRMVPLCKP